MADSPEEIADGQEEVETSTKAEVKKMIEIAEEELTALKGELSDCKDKYLRSIAEAENARKRLHKERQDMTQMAVQTVIVDFLNPIDHMEKALSFTDNMSSDVQNWAIGFKMILNQFKDVLSSNDVHPFTSLGTHFDPHVHEAIETEETNKVAPGTVVEETLQGYKMGKKVIRPARVKVSKPVTMKPETEE